MKTRNSSQQRAKLFTGKWAAALLLAASLIFTACPNNAGGGKIPPAEYTVNFGVEGGNGTLTAAVDGKAITAGAKVQTGKTVKFTAAPTDPAAYDVDYWTVSGGSFAAAPGSGTTAEVKVGTKDLTVKVKFKPKGSAPSEFTVNFAVDGGNGTLKATVDGAEIGDGAKVQAGKTVTFTATPDDPAAYEVYMWDVTGGGFATGGGNGSTQATLIVGADVAVTVKFKPKGAPSAIDGVWRVVSQTEADGTTTAFPETDTDGTKIQPYWCFWEGMLYSAEQISNSPDELENGLYKENDPIPFTFDGTKIVVDGNVASVTLSGNTMTLTAMNNPAERMVFEKTASPTVQEIQTAPFRCYIHFEVDGTGGSLKAEVDGKEIDSGSPVEQGKTVKFTAEPDDPAAYEVDTWDVTGGGTVTSGGKNGDTQATLIVNEDVSVTVTFKPKGSTPPSGFTAVLTLSPDKKDIKVRVKTADGSPVTVGGCTETELTSGTQTELNANGTTVTLTGKITELHCLDNKLTALDVKGLPDLKELYCPGNQLTTLDVQGLPALQTLFCADNQLTTLDVQGLPVLQWLDCSGNQLPALDVHGCTALKTLYCYGNKLTADAFKQLFNGLPTWISDNAKCYLYAEVIGVSEGNHTVFTDPPELYEAFNNAKTVKKWKMYKYIASWNEVEL